MEGKIDEDLYSRQIYAFGLESLLTLSKLNVLVVGCDALGVEVAKNLILSGELWHIAVGKKGRGGVKTPRNFWVFCCCCCCGEQKLFLFPSSSSSFSFLLLKQKAWTKKDRGVLPSMIPLLLRGWI